MTRGVLGEHDGVVRGLRAAVHDDRESMMRGGHELVGREPALVHVEENSLAGRPECEDAVET